MAESTMTANRPAWRGTPLVLAMLCGIVAYSDSFRGTFIFDDIDAILNNPHVNRSLTDSGRTTPTTLSGRPVLWASFAADYAIGGLRVEVYHVTNLLIHLACGAILFGIVRRNLSSPRIWGNRFQTSAHWLAGAVAAVWLVHPLNTEAVTYTVQRAESLTGMFYLLVIYFLIRDWKLAAVAACALGMGSKEVMATAPLMALIYDRTFISGSFASALKARAALYLALAATWIIPVEIVLAGSRSASVGDIPPMDYARTQLGVIAHYIALAFWPRNLVLDYYDWPIAHSLGRGGMLIALSIALSIVFLWRKPWLGFLGAWFFIILAPSSSVLPIFTEIAAEHRMYLPLIAPVALVVVGGWVILSRSAAGGWIAGILLTILLASLSARTFLRNAEYQDPELIWSDNVRLRPANPRAHFNLGFTRMAMGRPAEAVSEFHEALQLAPDYYAAASALGRALVQSGNSSEAEKFYTDEMSILPAFSAEAHLDRGRLRTARGDFAGANEDFQAVTRPDGRAP
jgi:protein O-mannosyl-transferase